MQSFILSVLLGQGTQAHRTNQSTGFDGENMEFFVYKPYANRTISLHATYMYETDFIVEKDVHNAIKHFGILAVEK